MSKLITDISLLRASTSGGLSRQAKGNDRYNSLTNSITYTLFAQIADYDPNSSSITLKSLPFIDDVTTVPILIDDDTIWDLKKHDMIKGLPVQCKIVPIIDSKELQTTKDSEEEEDNDSYVDDSNNWLFEEMDVEQTIDNEEDKPKFKLVRCIEIHMNDLNLQGFKLAQKIQNLNQ